jgi:hypothetical protein
MIIEGHEPNPGLRYIVTFSGGKDSVATWLYLTRELLLPKVECIFSDTGHEADQTYEYLGLLEREHGLPIERIQPTIEVFRGEMGEAKIRERLGVPEGVDVWKEPLTMERLSMSMSSTTTWPLTGGWRPLRARMTRTAWASDTSAFTLFCAMTMSARALDALTLLRSGCTMGLPLRVTMRLPRSVPAPR